MQSLATHAILLTSRKWAWLVGVSIAVQRDERKAVMGLDHEADSRMDGCPFERCTDTLGTSMVPGLVDAHTPHLGGGQSARVHNEVDNVIG